MNGNIIIKNASELVTCSGFKAKRGKEMAELHIIHDGAVVVKEGRISAVGTTNEIFTEIEKAKLDLSAFDTIDIYRN
jgi:imidazolonepropionase